ARASRSTSAPAVTNARRKPTAPSAATRRLTTPALAARAPPANAWRLASPVRRQAHEWTSRDWAPSRKQSSHWVQVERVVVDSAAACSSAGRYLPSAHEHAPLQFTVLRGHPRQHDRLGLPRARVETHPEPRSFCRGVREQSRGYATAVRDGVRRPRLR